MDSDQIVQYKCWALQWTKIKQWPILRAFDMIDIICEQFIQGMNIIVWFIFHASFSV